ncbi:MAG TPA: PAS domain S-box protein [Verrucomicrobiae bacterium]|jgi:PAS domain S-box-containing protein
MAILLNVLVVEDSENDSTLLLEELRRKNFSPIFQRVQTAKEMSAALELRSWDVIVSDYVMPNFSGPDALLLLQEKGLDIPFLVVSGTYGEEAAVHMMKAGANDYIVKGNLSRLAPAIEREMGAAKSRRAHKKAEENGRILAAIVESTDDAIFGKNLDGTIISWNRAAEQIFGYRAREIIGRSVALLFPRDRRDELIDMMERIQKGEHVGIHESTRVRKDGVIIPVSATISPIIDGDGVIVGASDITRDITERKQIDEDRTRLIGELTEALKQVKTLKGLLPICASCKRIRDDGGYWQQVECYISARTDAGFTHGICPECADKFRSTIPVKSAGSAPV